MRQRSGEALCLLSSFMPSPCWRSSFSRRLGDPFPPRMRRSRSDTGIAACFARMSCSQCLSYRLHRRRRSQCQRRSRPWKQPPHRRNARPVIQAKQFFSAAILADPRSWQALEGLSQLAADEQIVQLCNLEAIASSSLEGELQTGHSRRLRNGQDQAVRAETQRRWGGLSQQGTLVQHQVWLRCRAGYQKRRRLRISGW